MVSTADSKFFAEQASFPVSLGWHPWFRRKLECGAPAVLYFRADQVYENDADRIPNGTLARPGPGPWDACFTKLDAPPRLIWPGALSLTLDSDLDHWVMYDEPAHAICVEPMSGAPDARNQAPLIVEPGRPLTGTFRLSWSARPGQPVAAAPNRT
jgi:galactose mutarotase-like enzyme